MTTSTPTPDQTTNEQSTGDQSTSGETGHDQTGNAASADQTTAIIPVDSGPAGASYAGTGYSRAPAAADAAYTSGPAYTTGTTGTPGTAPGASQGAPAFPGQPVYPAASGPVYAPAPTPARTNVLGVVTLVLGILGFGVVPVVTGHLALAQIKKSGEEGRGITLAGLILGYVTVAGWLAVLLFWVAITGFAVLGAVAGSGYGY